MPFISVSDEVIKKSLTAVENKFITKYLPILEPMAVKVYLYALYIYQNGMSSMTIDDLAANLGIAKEQAINYFEYLEEFELVSISSLAPFEIKILEADNNYGTPKKFNPEKYSDFTKNIQNIIKGRMISTNEFRDYFCLLEDYGFEQNALLMIINYCVNLKGDDIRSAYIKKVAKNFAEEGITTVGKVDEKLASYTSSTPSLLKIFTAVGIRRQPDVEDDVMYKKWTRELGFNDEAVIAAAKLFKVKSVEKLDGVLYELYKNKKFDVIEIADYCKNRNSVYELTLNIAKNMGIYIQNPTPYVENYVNTWCNYGFSADSLLLLSAYCFKHENNSFEDMNRLISSLYEGGNVSDSCVEEFIAQKNYEDKVIKSIHEACGLTRKIIAWDRECLSRWKNWNFSDEMILEAAKISVGKSNPIAYMNGVLSSWKSDGIYSPENISIAKSPSAPDRTSSVERAEIERHYAELRHAAESRADEAMKKAMSDSVYAELRRKINSLNIRLAFAEIHDKAEADNISKNISTLEMKADNRLSEIGIDKSALSPKYSCPICNDTGYTSTGEPCKCMAEFIKTLKM